MKSILKRSCRSDSSGPTPWYLSVVVMTVGILSAFAPGCMPSGTAEPAEPAVATEPEPAVPVLPDCVDNVDCQGGEVCRDDVCRTACESDDDCSGFFGRCDLDLGFCVACVSNDDCDSDEACGVDGLCAFFCTDDAQCGATEFCDEGAGTCEDRECDGNADCPGGFSCEDFRCVNLDPIICEAESVTCDGDTVVTCNRDGTSEERVACESGFVCRLVDGVGTCRERVCEPNALGCTDDSTAFACDGTGTEQTLLPCRDDQFCTDGVCQNQVCTPNSVTCDGATLVTCDSTGATRDTQACGTTAACEAEPFGCSCIVDACVPRVCRPESRECVGNGFRTCDADGAGFGAPQTCADSCVAGACVASSCLAGETLCSGDALLVCNSEGNGYAVTDCAIGNETCVTTGGVSSCAAPICEPLSTTCTDDFTGVVTCNAFGTEASAAPCGEDQYCDAGLCRAEVCAPGTTECVGGNSVRTCSALGDAETVTECGEGETCSNGVCSNPVCTPDCTGRVCGPDPICGESCGPCSGTCTAAGQCEGNTGELEIEVTWDETFDLDLHLSRGDDAFCAADSCNYLRCKPTANTPVEWDGVGGRTDGDPVLEADSFTAGPERIRIVAPNDGVYRARVHHYPAFNSADAPTTATLVVRSGGSEVGRFSKAIEREEVWDSVVITVNGASTSTEDEDGIIVFPGTECDSEPPDLDGGPGPDVDGGPTSSLCTVNADCPDGEFCSVTLVIGSCLEGCRSDSECGPFESCNGNGECTVGALSPWQGGCSSSADCQAGLACGILSTCVEFCTAPGTCNAANPCCEVSGASQCTQDIFGGFVATCSN